MNKDLSIYYRKEHSTDTALMLSWKPCMVNSCVTLTIFLTLIKPCSVQPSDQPHLTGGVRQRFVLVLAAVYCYVVQ